VLVIGEREIAPIRGWCAACTVVAEKGRLAVRNHALTTLLALALTVPCAGCDGSIADTGGTDDLRCRMRPCGDAGGASPSVDGGSTHVHGSDGSTPPAPPPPPTPPGPTDITGDVHMSSLTIAAGDTFTFDPNNDTTLHLTGNLIVMGVLELKPARPDVDHIIVFEGISEGSFAGGGEDPVATDIGLWVMGSGKLDIAGTPRSGWLRSAAGLAAGATTITLESAPFGWAPGDEVLVVPTAPGDEDGFEVRTIASVSGAAVTLASGLGRAHPAAGGLTPEIASLTRNVQIGGTPDGRSHIFIRSTTPQLVRHALIRYTGPRRTDTFVLGRYSLHFHHCHDGSRGSIVEGVVVRDGGSHGYVPHGSNGITIHDSIAYTMNEAPFWWDPPAMRDDVHQSSFDSVWEHDLVADVVPGPGPTQPRIGGYILGLGDPAGAVSNTLTDSVAVGVRGGRFANGFQWPEAGQGGVWAFTSNVAHNNVAAVFVWQNDNSPHQVVGLRAYHNATGIHHGAYINEYHYDGLVLAGQSDVAVEMLAVSRGRGIALTNFTVSDTPVGLKISHHNLPPENPALLRNWTMSSVATPVLVDESANPGMFDLVDFTIGGRALACSDITVTAMHAESVIRVQNGASAFRVTPAGCSPIAAFAP